MVVGKIYYCNLVKLNIRDGADTVGWIHTNPREHLKMIFIKKYKKCLSANLDDEISSKYN